MDAEALLAPLKQLSPERVLLPVLVQLIVILLAARLFAFIFRRLGQPSVVGEIAAGLVLGPSVLGRLSPDVMEFIFHPQLGPGVNPALADATLNWILQTLSHLGLIFLLFLVGLEFDYSHLRVRGKSAAAISLAGIALPFAFGLVLSQLILPAAEPHPHATSPPPQLGFALFLGTALAITAIPVLGRIMLELNITRTRLGTIAISAAAIDDATGWILLATVAAIVRGNFEPAAALLMIGETVAFAAVLLLFVRPLLARWARRALVRGDGDLSATDMALLMAVILGAAVVTNLIGIFAIFGAFLLGAALSGNADFRAAVQRQLQGFVTIFFMPIFFTFTGLRTDIGALHTPAHWLLCGAVLLAAVVGKLGGCGLAARLTGFSTRESLCIGTLMNARGLMELVVINVGYELQVIPRSVYCMLVIMALATTVMTTPLLLRLMQGTELQGRIEDSGFGVQGKDRRARRSKDSVGTKPR